MNNDFEKYTAWAPVNVALIKYWGKRNENLRLPANSSFSVCLSDLGTTTTVEFIKKRGEDEVVINGVVACDRERKRVVEHLDKVRKFAKISWKAKVVSKNNFAKGVGLSSSASGFAALSLAASKAARLDLGEEDLSRLARMGSGSACRSIADGWVEWKAGKTDKDSYGYSIFGEKHWNVRILVVLLSQEEKKISSTDGHSIAGTSLYYKQRLKIAEMNLKKIKNYIRKKDFKRFGETMEDEALSMHAVMLTSKPNLIYWLPETVRVIKAIKEWREEGLEGYFTINTGQNVFVFCLADKEEELIRKLKEVNGVTEVLKDRVGKGARLINNHLF